MADNYQTISPTGEIGNLLRMIQEEKASSVLNAPPSAQPGSPIRDLAQGPILSPESPGSTRVTSLRPEGIPSATDVVAPVNPVAPVAAPSAALGPVGPQTPANRIASNSGFVPTGTLLNNAPKSFPSIGTSIKASPTIKSSPVATPQRTRTGTIIAKSTPQYEGFFKGQGKIDKIIQKVLDRTPGNFTQKIAPRLFASSNSNKA